MTYYVGGEIALNDILGEGNPRFFYALRRQDTGNTAGNLYFTKNQLKSKKINRKPCLAARL